MEDEPQPSKHEIPLLNTQTAAQNSTIKKNQRQLEDLDNRNRRNKYQNKGFTKVTKSEDQKRLYMNFLTISWMNLKKTQDTHIRQPLLMTL